MCKIQSLGFKFGICKKVGKNLEIYIDGQDVKKVGNNQIFNTEYLSADLEFNILVLENFVFDADSEYRIL